MRVHVDPILLAPRMAQPAQETPLRPCMGRTRGLGGFQVRSWREGCSVRIQVKDAAGDPH
jgi:hypothetical protein